MNDTWTKFDETDTLLQVYMIKGTVTYLKENEDYFKPEDAFSEIQEEFEAFNDIIIGEFNAWINYDCKHEDNILGNFNAAGLLISTSQGSTGANRNNNGTILPLSSKNWSVAGVMSK